jgi:hypothetical protein
MTPLIEKSEEFQKKQFNFLECSDSIFSIKRKDFKLFLDLDLAA